MKFNLLKKNLFAINLNGFILSKSLVIVILSDEVILLSIVNQKIQLLSHNLTFVNGSNHRAKTIYQILTIAIK